MPRYYIIQCRSLTYAQRARRLLEQSGLFAAQARVPQELSGEGCNHGVRVRAQDLERATRLLDAAGLQRKRLIAVYDDGKAKEVRP